MIKSDKTKPVTTVDDYIKVFPVAVQTKLEKLRKVIKAAAPEATETISYQMPAYHYLGVLVYFAAYKNHIGFYPTGSGIEAFQKEISGYKWSKGAVQFPLDQPLPFDLITKMVKFRVKKNSEKAKAKTKKQGSTKLNDADKVKSYLNKLNPTVRAEIEAVRRIIKASSSKLNERIKWNAPSYFYKEDILTFGPYKKDRLLLVVHHPYVVKINSKLLTGDYKDRRLITFKNKAEAELHKKEITRIIKAIIKMTDTNHPVK